MADVRGPNTKAQLRRLRDQMDFAIRRAQGRERTPPQLLRRMLTTAETLESVCLLKPTADNAEALEEAYADALVEAHLAMHEWERFHREDSTVDKPARASPTRQHARVNIDVTVKLRHFSVHDQAGGKAIEAQHSSLPARNISIGGVYVVAAPTVHPELVTGNVVMASLTLGPDGRQFRLRAAITRRDNEGIGLRWIADDLMAQKNIAALLETVNNSRG